MRESFSKVLVEHIRADKTAYLLSGDHGYALFDQLRKELPEHFINAGVAEQNMIGVGAGLAKLGFYPMMYGLSAFVPIRVLEQIKIDFCYENLPGLFIGDGAGVVYSHLGTSHQSTEDIAALRAVPHISILSPADAVEFRACFKWAVQQRGPVYLRMGKADLGAIHSAELEVLESAPLPIIQKQNKTAVFATGSMVKPCLNLINSGRITADLYSVPVLKLGSGTVDLSVLRSYEKVVSVEEHSIYGGLGDLLAAEAAHEGHVKLLKIGIEDKFSQLCGTYQYLMKEHGLDEDGLRSKIMGFIA
jgi:transketolase